ncbi:MAG: class I SAM-dependent methyltransferase [Acidimicrobiales bacterium]
MSDGVDKIGRNRALWDDRVPAHVASDFYDVDGFKAGRVTVEPFEIEEVGPVDGLDLVHLQCHFGLDTLSWARLGAHVTGLDFSEPAVAAARRLAADIGVDAQFVTSDVHDAVAALGGRQFDVVYTGLGALNWLPDMDRWAGVVEQLLRPGGFLYLAEFHPLGDVFAYQDLTVAHSYWTGPEGMRSEGDGSYVETDDRFEHTESFEWNHPLSRVIGALLQRGLVLESFHEHPFTLYRRWPFLERRADGTYWMPDEMPQLPLIYSLKARKPA